jgi:hypothetical protein
MKIEKIEFDIEKFRSGEYAIITKNENRNVIIYTTEALGPYPIQGAIEKDKRDCVYSWTSNGREIEGNGKHGDNDLFLFKNIFEDGDIISNEKGVTLDYRGYYSKVPVIYANYCLQEDGSTLEYCISRWALDYNINDFHLSNESELEKFFEALRKIGKTWNSTKRKVEDKANINSLFDKVLVRNSLDELWTADFFISEQDSYKFVSVGKKKKFECFRGSWNMCIPYNKETEILFKNKK